MEIHELLTCGLLLLVHAVIRLYQYITTPRHEQAFTLKAGETFLGVLDRGKQDCVFIGDAPGRAYKNITAEEVKLLKQVLEPEGGSTFHP